MTRYSKHLGKLIFILAGSAACSPAGFAQINSNIGSIALTATLPETLSISVTPASTSFTLVPGGTAVASAPIAITTGWVLSAGRAAIALDAYFSSSSAALTSGGSTPVNIPTSEVLGQVTTGTPTAFTAFSQTGALGPSGAGLILFSQSLTSTTREANRTDNLNLEINLSSQPQLPAGTYTGTLTIQAQSL